VNDIAPKPPPRVDDHFVVEGARVEVVRGILLMAPPAGEPHATVHLTLAYLLAAHVGEGFVAAVDMLTRTSDDSDFAPDASVYPEARDPRTGGRQLEELAFEIASTQPLDSAGEKARELVRRGVRRVFCIGVKHRRVLEWSRDTDGWSPLLGSTAIDDPCFVRPLPVRALLDAAAADEAVIAALDAREHPAIRAIEARGEARGEARAFLKLLAARGLVPNPAEAERIRGADVATLDRWFDRALAPDAPTSLGALLE
jgi:Uma2 family endonuclease